MIASLLTLNKFIAVCNGIAVENDCSLRQCPSIDGSARLKCNSVIDNTLPSK
jgi:hypothetical protein